MEFETNILNDMGRALAFIALYVVLFLFAKWLKDFITPYKLDEQLTQHDNLAVGLSVSGYYLATVAIFIGALLGPSQGFMQDLVTVGGYTLLGLIFLSLSRFVNDKLILKKFSNVEQISKEQNVAVGAVQCGVYIATGLIAAGAVTGQGGGVLTAIVFFIIGQISLIAFSYIYDLLTPYCIHDELERKNTAAGVAFGGTIIALGIIIMNGVAVDFISWQSNLIDIVLVNVMAFIFLPIIRLFMDKLVIPGDDLAREIKEDQNLAAGFLEAVVAISFALVLKSII